MPTVFQCRVLVREPKRGIGDGDISLGRERRLGMTSAQVLAKKIRKNYTGDIEIPDYRDRVNL